jgi:hypothetical protein
MSTAQEWVAANMIFLRNPGAPRSLAEVLAILRKTSAGLAKSKVQACNGRVGVSGKLADVRKPFQVCALPGSVNIGAEH